MKGEEVMTMDDKGEAKGVRAPRYLIDSGSRGWGR